MAQLEQIQIVFVPEQDRLLLRVNTSDRSEFRFWLTRRLVKLLWPVLQKTLETNPQIITQADVAAKEAVKAFQREKALMNTDFKTPYRNDATELPLGAEPVLVTRVQIKNPTKESRVLCLHPSKGHGIELALNEPTLHSLCALLRTTVARAEWGLELGEEAPKVVEAKPESDRVN